MTSSARTKPTQIPLPAASPRIQLPPFSSVTTGPACSSAAMMRSCWRPAFGTGEMPAGDRRSGCEGGAVRLVEIADVIEREVEGQTQRYEG